MKPTYVDGRPLRPAWVEIDLGRLSANFDRFLADKPPGLAFLSVVKDDAYGHGILEVSRLALQKGIRYLGVVSIDEALHLRENGIQAPILLFGERPPEQIPWCVRFHLTCSVTDLTFARDLAREARKQDKRAVVHIKVNTGMNRYGVRWDRAAALVEQLRELPELVIEGIYSHFSQSDEKDKTFALLQLERFESVLAQLSRKGRSIPLRHLANSGGYLDLPQAHFDMVRIGILPLGVFPSLVCRRIPGIEPIMSVKARIAAIQELQGGDKVGYGMHYTAPGTRRIAVIPVGYGDGFPRVRNRGCVLIHGQRAPIVGGNAMDAMMVDVSEIADVKQWDEVVIMGRQGAEEITARDIAGLKNSVTYDVLTSWRHRLPRVFLDESA